MKLLPLLLLFPAVCLGQNWSGILTATASGNYAPTPAAGAAPGVAIDWSNNGIPGGVPDRSTLTQCGSTISAPSSTSAILSALSSCGGTSGSHKYVLLAAGTFTISSQLLSIPAYTELRGAGPDQTILSLSGTGPTVCSDTYSCAINLGVTGDIHYTSPLTVSSGATAGSTSLTLASTTGVSVGGYLIISETNAAWVSAAGGEGQCNWCDASWTADGNRARGQIVEVTALVGSVATISPALYTDYTNTPTVIAATMTKYAGLRDLQVFDTNTYTGDPVDISLNRCAYCYVQNVEVNYTAGDFVHLTWGYRDEVRDSYFSNSFLHAAGCCDAAVNVQYKTSASKVENNIIERGHASIMMEWGAAGNTISYNYEHGAYHNPTTFVIGGVNMHGAHPQFNLVEGNAMSQFYPDQVWGSSSHNTLFRNWIRGTTLTCPPYTDGQRNTVNCSVGATQSKYGSIAAQIAHWSWYDNFIGDILGSSQQQALGTVAAIINYNTTRDAFTTKEWNMSFGYGESNDQGTGTGCAGGTSPCNGVQPAQTSFLYKEYTFANTTSNCTVGGNAGTCSATLPGSFYLSAKPAWWTNGMSFPCIGPDVSGGSGPGGHICGSYANPAMKCYLSTMGGVEGGTGSPLSFNANNCYVAASTPTGSMLLSGAKMTAGVVIQ